MQTPYFMFTLKLDKHINVYFHNTKLSQDNKVMQIHHVVALDVLFT